MHDSFFSRLAQWTGLQLGKAYTFAAACLLIVVWAVSGPLLQLLRHLATSDQYRYYHRNLPDGLLTSAHTKS